MAVFQSANLNFGGGNSQTKLKYMSKVQISFSLFLFFTGLQTLFPEVVETNLLCCQK